MRHRSLDSRHPENVVFATSDDVAYSQIATAWFSLLADPRKATAVLGVPRLPVRVEAPILAAMWESGADLKRLRPQLLTPALVQASDLVVTLGATFERLLIGAPAPVYREHWLVDVGAAYGPGAGLTSRARSLRDLIRSRVAMLVFTEGWVRANISGEQARVTRPRWHSEALPAF